MGVYDGDSAADALVGEAFPAGGSVAEYALERRVDLLIDNTR